MSRFLPDGRLFVVREAKGEGLEITLWDSEGRRRLAGPWTSPLGIVTVSPDGRSYYKVSSNERSGRFWIKQFDMATGRAVGIPTEIPATRQGPLWTPDGRVALLVNGVGRVRVYLPIDATVPDPFRPLDEGAVAVSPTGRWFAVARTDHLAVFEPGDDWTDTVAQLAVGPSAAVGENEAPRIAASPDRTTELLPLCAEPGAVEIVLREADSGRPIGPGLRIPVEGDAPPITAAFSPSGRLVAVASGMTTRLLDARSGASIGPPLAHDDTATCLAFSPDGDMLAVGNPGGGVSLWDVEAGRPARAPLALPGAVREVVFFPGGRLAIRSDSARPGVEVVRLWDAGGGRPIGPEIVLDGDDDIVYSPDGDRIMRLSKNTVRFVETQTGRAAGEPHQLFREHIRRSQGVSTAAFAGDRLGVIGTGKGTIRLFDATTGRPIPGMAMSHPGRAPVLGLAVSPDGRSALTGHLDGTACLWDLTTSRAMGPPVRACREVVAVAFSPDGRWAMLVSPRGRTWRWPVPGPVDVDPDRLALQLELETGVRLAPGPTAVELTERQWLERRDRLLSMGADPSSPLVPRPDDLEWHAFRAFEAEEVEAIETAAWHLEVLSRLRPGDWTIPARIGAMLADAGRPGRASAVCDWAEADAEAGEVASWYRLRALEALASRRFEAARRDLDRALARVPDDARALADRALSRSALGDDAGADADTARAVALAEDGDLLVVLGSRLAAAGRWEEARVPFARAVATAPMTLLDRERAALALLRAGDSEAFRLLVDRLIEALREPPASPTRLLVEARPGLLGPTNPEQAGRIAAILDRECDRLARRPDVPAELRHSIHSAAGAAMYRAGRHAEAVDRLEEGIAARGGNIQPWDDAFLALAHQTLGHRDEAMHHLDRLADVAPRQNFWEALEYRLLRREAESVIRPDLGFPGDPFDRD
ncbi:WD domain, G-beta repeat [Tautonia plasticadhaerens]|uniref:WD domain, G-beta repeat n=2 Tax=Tautonia plasticadhaerens TaxID=2527974 RepID=A0A518H6I3_9BACT|nr:WD domain, G-beta repeat [Tautonia plasticadhaerens]